MYLVDTSVWINTFRQVDNAAVRYFRRILDLGRGYGITSVIYQEVLQGARSEKDFRELHEYLGSQRFYQPIDPVQSYSDAAQIYFRCRIQGITIRSTIDCLIAQIAIEHDLILLHNDRDFEHMAGVLPALKLA